MLCIGAIHLPRIAEWQVSELEYITTQSQHHISDRKNGILYSCGGFRISEQFEIEEFLKPGGPLPPAIFASNGLEFPRDSALVAKEFP
jgi:hypothetical protein